MSNYEKLHPMGLRENPDAQTRHRRVRRCARNARFRPEHHRRQPEIAVHAATAPSSSNTAPVIRRSTMTGTERSRPWPPRTARAATDHSANAEPSPRSRRSGNAPPGWRSAAGSGRPIRRRKSRRMLSLPSGDESPPPERRGHSHRDPTPRMHRSPRRGTSRQRRHRRSATATRRTTPRRSSSRSPRGRGTRWRHPATRPRDGPSKPATATRTSSCPAVPQRRSPDTPPRRSRSSSHPPAGTTWFGDRPGLTGSNPLGHASARRCHQADGQLYTRKKVQATPSTTYMRATAAPSRI